MLFWEPREFLQEADCGSTKERKLSGCGQCLHWSPGALLLCLINCRILYSEKRQGMCLLAFIPSQLHADEKWDFNNGKLRPGNLTSKSCNLLCFHSVKPHRFSFVYNRFLSREQIKKSHILLTMYTWTLFIENVLWVNTSFIKFSIKSISVVFWHDIGVHISSL